MQLTSQVPPTLNVQLLCIYDNGIDKKELWSELTLKNKTENVYLSFDLNPKQKHLSNLQTEFGAFKVMHLPIKLFKIELDKRI